jgi:23S rRNA pseudouridine1911/1915/1917 synthase
VSPGNLVRVLAVAYDSEVQPDASVEFGVLFSDPSMIVVDKPAGLVVHPAPGNEHGTLVNGLLARFPELRDASGDQRPGIVHRLDKDTSGIMVVGRTVEATAALQRQMKARTAEKRSLALALGSLGDDEGIIDAPIARDARQRQRMAVRPEGRESQTHFFVKERFGDFTYLEVLLKTGRTHQIRVHFASIGHPVAGDPVYGNGRGPAGLRRHFLHSHLLRIRSPFDGQERRFTAPLPADLAAPLDWLRRRGPRG